MTGAMIMRFAKWLIPVLMLCLFAACGSGDGEDSPAPAPAKTKTPAPPINNDANAPTQMGAFIDSVTIKPEDLSAETPAHVTATLKKELLETQYFNFRFMKNGQKVQEGPDPILPAGSMTKGDILWVEVFIMENGEELDTVKTAQFFARNAPPRIDDIVLPSVKGPGTYTFAVKAADPDKDPLTYAVSGDNFPFQYTIDNTAGVISCTLGNDIPEAIEFTVTVDDGFGGTAEKIVSMNFFKKPVKEGAPE